MLEGVVAIGLDFEHTCNHRPRDSGREHAYPVKCSTARLRLLLLTVVVLSNGFTR